MRLPGWLRGKESAWSLIPGSGGSHGGGNGNPPQCSCLGNPMGKGAWRATATGSQSAGHDRVAKHHHRGASSRLGAAGSEPHMRRFSVLITTAAPRWCLPCCPKAAESGSKRRPAGLGSTVSGRTRARLTQAVSSFSFLLAVLAWTQGARFP